MDTAPRGCLIAGRNDLFGARMLPFVNALRIGHDYGIDVKIYWPTAGASDTNIAEYTDIFSAEFISKHFISLEKYSELSKSAVPLSKGQTRAVDDVISQVNSGTIFALNGTHPKLMLSGEDPSVVHESYHKTLDRISFTAETQRNIDRIHKAIGSTEFTAYHVRHGDVTTAYRAKNKAWTNKFVPSVFYAEHFKSHQTNNTDKALLFGDFKPSLDWLCKECPEFMQIGDVIEFGDLGSLQRDFLEFYAMSRATKIIGPSSSGFSQLAAGLGGIELLDIMTQLSPSNYANAFNRLYDIIDHKPDELSNNGEIAQSLAHLVPYLHSKNRSGDAAALLHKEISRGNTITFLFSMLADTYAKIGDQEGLIKLRQQSLAVPMSDAKAVANVDAACAAAEYKLGNPKEASRLLSLALFQNPKSGKVRSVYQTFDRKGLLNSENCYPIDHDLMSCLVPNPRSFQSVYFIWEWRHYLISNFKRSLTHAGSANVLLGQMKCAFERSKRSDRQTASFLSFQSMIHMDTGSPEHGLNLSMDAIDTVPDDPFILKRHIQNLIQIKNHQLALNFAKELIKIEPEKQFPKMLLADCYFGLRNRKKALSIYSKLKPCSIYYTATSLKHARLLRIRKRPEEAIAVLDRVLPELRWPDQHLEAYTLSKLDVGAYDDIYPFLSKLGKEAYQERHINHLLAKINMAQGDTEGAINHAKRAVRYAPLLIRHKQLLADIYIDAGRRSDAEDIIAQLPEKLQNLYKA